MEDMMSSTSKFQAASLTRGAFFLLVLVGAMCAAGVASAAPTQMWSFHTLTIQSFAQTTTTGASYPYSLDIYLGVPVGVFCNDLKGGDNCYGYSTIAQQGDPMTGFQFRTIETSVSKPGFSMPEGKIRKKLGTLATTFISGPNGTIRPGNGVPGGSFSEYTRYLYEFTYADLKNEAGFFAPGDGGQAFTDTQPLEGGLPAGKVTVTPHDGSPRFGGTMKLLGYYVSTGSFQQDVGQSIGVHNDWLFTLLGGGEFGSVTTPIAGKLVDTTTNTAINTDVGAAYTSVVKGSAFPWTTGKASVTAVRGPAAGFTNNLVRSGYDNRTAGGFGMVQMVSPMLTHWDCADCGGVNIYETAAIGIMNIEFVPVPEPTHALMLFSGLSFLGLTYRATRRK